MRVCSAAPNSSRDKFLAAAEKAINRTPQGPYRFEMKASVDPRDGTKLHEILREVLRELPGCDRPVRAK